MSSNMSFTLTLGRFHAHLALFKHLKMVINFHLFNWWLFRVQQIPPTWVGCGGLGDWTAQLGAPSVSHYTSWNSFSVMLSVLLQVLELQAGYWSLGSWLGHLLQSWLGIKVNFPFSLVCIWYLHGGVNVANVCYIATGHLLCGLRLLLLISCLIWFM